MVSPSKSRPPMSHRKTDLGIPCRSKSAKVVLGRVLINGSSVCFGGQNGKHLLIARFTGFVQGFGCRPCEMLRRAPGPASGSRQRTNPRDGAAPLWVFDWIGGNVQASVVSLHLINCVADT